VNTRLQVEHPVSEETTGIDLVCEQLRIARGERLRMSHDPQPRGHAFEFRINAEDPARNFVPIPGVITVFEPPSGPGVRLDVGVRAGSAVGAEFDSLLGKLIVVGADRAQALARARRALAEFRIEGLPTVLPFHRAVVDDPAFAASCAAGFTVHTGWIETGFRSPLPPYQGELAPPPAMLPRQSVVVEVGGRRLEVSLPGELALPGAVAPGAALTGAAPLGGARVPPRRRVGGRVAPSGDDVLAPMQGTVVRVAVSEGDRVDTGDLLVVLEAMKMENPVTAHKPGTVTGLRVQLGGSVTQGSLLCSLR
jgi:acetyl-CoA/propionyl-CoA carboxylase biotin carboxyl carrier protein